jgi:hypothetical protein
LSRFLGDVSVPGATETSPWNRDTTADTESSAPDTENSPCYRVIAP